MGMLPDDVLLSIFAFCANGEEEDRPQQVWQTLVHVCPRWRCLVFGSPRSLNLELICTSRTPARDLLDVWPPLPLVIAPVWFHSDPPIENADNIVAALEHRNRACRIYITDISSFSSSDLEKVLAAMRGPFPELTRLIINLGRKTVAVLPDLFLGGSAPRLRVLELHCISFLGLPKLLLSTTHLTDLRLYDIPHSGFISPEAMITAFSTLGSLGELHLGFRSPLSLPNQASRRPRSPKRFVLPVLTEFYFAGVSEYLDDLVARIDAPRLVRLYVNFFNQILFDTPQLVQFITRTPALKAPEKARVIFKDRVAVIKLSRASGYGDLTVAILCENMDWQVSSMEQVCTSCLPPFYTLEDLCITEDLDLQPDRQDNIENTLWVELFQPFTAVKSLYLSEDFAPRIMPSLKALVGERTTEALPTLQNIFLEGLETSGPLQTGIQEFVATRQASQPIAVSRWDRFGSR